MDFVYFGNIFRNVYYSFIIMNTKNMNDAEYIIIDNTGLCEIDNDIIIKHYFGVQCENFILIKESKRLSFSIFRLNGVYYININGEHIIDYAKLINVYYIKNQEESVKIKSKHFGEITLDNCNVDLVKKALEIMNRELKKKYKWYKELFFFIIH